MKPNSRSQSLIELNTNKNNNSTLKRTTLSSSSVALSSPSKDEHSNDEAKNESKVMITNSFKSHSNEKMNFPRIFFQSETASQSESEEQNDSSSEEESSTEATNQTSKQSSDDDDVEIRPTKTFQNKRNSIQEHLTFRGKPSAPVPQVRFSKLNNGRK